MNIVELFLRSAEKYPQSPAIVSKKNEVSYLELSEEVKKTAGYFRSKGLSKGDNVLVFVPMSTDLYRVLLALFYIGARAVFVDEWAKSSRLNACCKVAACKAIIGVPKAKLLRFFSKEIRKIPLWLKISGRSREVDIVPVEDADTALITFTTGSTGLPKAARRTHGFLMEQFKALQKEIKPSSQDIELTTLPILLFNNLGSGCTSVLPDFPTGKPQKFKPERLLRSLKEKRVDRLVSSPFFIRRLAEHMIDNGESLPSLRKIFTGGAALFPSDAKKIIQAFPEAEITVAYGSTEAEPISSITATELASTTMDKGLAVGIPFEDISVEIIKIKDEVIELGSNEHISDISVGQGEIGEIAVSGPHVLEEYYRSDKAWNRYKIRDNELIWHRTGDSGYIENGRLFLCGSTQQLIYRDDKLISPFLIESSLKEIDGVQAGTLIEINSELILVIESALNEAPEQIKYLDIPYDQVKIVRKIPRDPRHHSKINYGELRKKFPS